MVKIRLGSYQKCNVVIYLAFGNIFSSRKKKKKANDVQSFLQPAGKGAAVVVN